MVFILKQLTQAASQYHESPVSRLQRKHCLHIKILDNFFRRTRDQYKSLTCSLRSSSFGWTALTFPEEGLGAFLGKSLIIFDTGERVFTTSFFSTLMLLGAYLILRLRTVGVARVSVGVRQVGLGGLHLDRQVQERVLQILHHSFVTVPGIRK